MKLNEVLFFFGWNMNIIWGVMMVMLLTEIGFCTLITLPLPALVRNNILYYSAYLWYKSPRFRIIIKTIMFIIGFFLIDALREIYTILYAQQAADPLGAGQINDVTRILYEAERNALLSGFTLFLTGIILRIISMSETLRHIEQKLGLLSESEKQRVEKLWDEQERASGIGRYVKQENLPVEPIKSD